MDVVYKKWESGKGLEEIQANIYTEVSGLPARPEEIGPRNDERGSDMTRYVLTKSNEPLAYVTSWESSDEPGRFGIGYPWSLSNCPKEAKERIFTEQLNYLKSKDGCKELRTVVVLASKTADDQIEFFEDQGFVETERIYRYNKDLAPHDSSKFEVKGKASKLTARQATNDYVDTLIELLHSDPRIRNAFPTEEGARGYFEGRVLADGHALILFEDDIAVAASALLKYEPDNFFLSADSTRIIPRFVAIRPGYNFAWTRLLVELSKEAINAGWKDIPIRVNFGFETSDPSAITLAETQDELQTFEIVMTLPME